jgi:hypothetical protein
MQALAKSNVHFYNRAKEKLEEIAPGRGVFYTMVLRIAEVVRYNPSSTDMGIAIKVYDRKSYKKKFGERPYGKNPRVHHYAWFLEVAGVEYMLEKFVFGAVDQDQYELSTDTWAVRFAFELGKEEDCIYWQTYMGQKQYLSWLKASGNILDLENQATVFALLSAELMPAIGKEF